MDAIIFITLALFYTIVQLNSKEEPKESNIESEDTTREAKLNPDMFEDTNAFMEVANALGFPKE